MSLDLDAIPRTWDAEPAVVGCLIGITAVYMGGLLRLSRERRLPANSLARAAGFVGGVGSLVIALLSPLDAWADRLFSAHMAQHLILMMIAPPLLIAGRPIAVAMWSMPAQARRAFATWWLGSPAVRPFVDVLRSPLAAWLAASAALWFWHLPTPYARAFDDAGWHALEHLTFLGSGILFWRVVIEHPQSRRLSLGATMLFVATFAIQGGMLGALLIFAPTVLYAVHAVAPAWSPLGPLEDQQLAGILMWLVTGVIDLGAMGSLFVAWLASGERRVARAP